MPIGTYVRTKEMYDSRRGKNNHFYGRKHSKKTRTKMRENHKGMLGKKMPEWFVEKMRKARTGKNNPCWKGGQYKRYGYIYLLKKDHPFANQRGYIRRSRFVMEQKIGRYLKPTEQVHHINGVKDDDRPENLSLFKSCGKHTKYHNELRSKTKDT